MFIVYLTLHKTVHDCPSRNYWQGCTCGSDRWSPCSAWRCPQSRGCCAPCSPGYSTGETVLAPAAGCCETWIFQSMKMKRLIVKITKLKRKELQMSNERCTINARFLLWFSPPTQILCFATSSVLVVSAARTTIGPNTAHARVIEVCPVKLQSRVRKDFTILLY